MHAAALACSPQPPGSVARARRTHCAAHRRARAILLYDSLVVTARWIHGWCSPGQDSTEQGQVFSDAAYAGDIAKLQAMLAESFDINTPDAVRCGAL